MTLYGTQLASSNCDENVPCTSELIILLNMIALGNRERFQDFIIEIIAGNGAYHLWYMGMIIRVYLFFPIILWVCTKVHLMNIKV